MFFSLNNLIVIFVISNLYCKIINLAFLTVMINCVLTSSINNVFKPADPSPLNYWTHVFMALAYLNDDILGPILFNIFLRKDFTITNSRYWKPLWIVIKLKEITTSLLLQNLNVVFIFYFTQIKIGY